MDVLIAGKKWEDMAEYILKCLITQLPKSERYAMGEQIRAERDDLIKNVRWRVERHKDEVALGLKTTEPIEPILKYIQQLRDIPQNKNFPNVKFPKEPVCGQKLKS